MTRGIRDDRVTVIRAAVRVRALMRHGPSARRNLFAPPPPLPQAPRKRSTTCSCFSSFSFSALPPLSTLYNRPPTAAYAFLIGPLGTLHTFAERMPWFPVQSTGPPRTQQIPLDAWQRYGMWRPNSSYPEVLSDSQRCENVRMVCRHCRSNGETVCTHDIGSPVRDTIV
jgi:hypothetical protein